MLTTIHPSWLQHLEQEFSAPYFGALMQFVESEYTAHTCYPERSQIFRALRLCPFDEVTKGQSVEVSFWSLNNQPVTGIIREIYPMADTVARTYKIRIALPN
ncbi:MAG: efflux RND transporter periplasmic adaptor subunit, partial [Bacteroidaceae bacterium]|nr:efflux RND transporter periplasmic adaptor subunit [Bacteroidaceae bacterium]